MKEIADVINAFEPHLSHRAGLGLSMASGSMTGGLQKIAALFIPLQAALYEHQMSESRFHNDESRWET